MHACAKCRNIHDMRHDITPERKEANAHMQAGFLPFLGTGGGVFGLAPAKDFV